MTAGLAAASRGCARALFAGRQAASPGIARAGSLHRRVVRSGGHPPGHL